MQKDQPESKTTYQLLNEMLKATQAQMMKNINQDLYGDDVALTYVKKPSWFAGLRRRITNAYDCLVKGVDPYDY